MRKIKSKRKKFMNLSMGLGSLLLFSAPFAAAMSSEARKEQANKSANSLKDQVNSLKTQGQNYNGKKIPEGPPIPAPDPKRHADINPAAGVADNVPEHYWKPSAAPQGIDYTAPQYRPWYDDGFNWEQLLGNKKDGYHEGMGDAILNQIMPSSKVINLGFVTSMDPKAINPGNVVQGGLKAFADANPKNVITSIGGVLPLWMANWTDAWGAKDPSCHQKGSEVYQLLNKIRESGRDYSFSFGGWNHDSLALSAYYKGYSAQQLKDLYAKIIDALDLKIVDFDIEGTDDGNTDDFGNTHPKKDGDQAKILRMQALKLLKSDSKYKDVHISLTLPALASGIPSYNEKMILEGMLLQKGMTTPIFDRLDIMAFDDPIWNSGKRITLPGEDAIYSMSATNSVAKFLADNKMPDPYSRLSVISMSGVEDSSWNVTTMSDMALLSDYAIQKGLNGFSFWSTNRDFEQKMVSGPKAFHEGHHFGMWKFEDMVNKTRKQDAYVTGLDTANDAYGAFGKNFAAKTKTDASNINIPPQLLSAINKKGIAKLSDTSKLTQADLDAIINSKYIFASSDKEGFGANLVTKAQSKQALQDELNFATWAKYYMDKNLK